MNTKFNKFTLLVMMAVLLGVASCKDSKQATTEITTEEATPEENQGKEYTSAYVCPMHCEGSGSETEGNCPTCGMAYVANDEHKKDGHTH
jgi:uncharacterized paraquat-inducible protein A